MRRHAPISHLRRRYLVALAAAVAATPAHAQKPPVIGVLLASDVEPTWSFFRKAMADLGYVDGRNVTYLLRNASASGGRLPVLAAELVKADVSLIVAVLTPAIVAAKEATTRIPIVFSGGTPDSGLVKNMARPEGNLTGIHGTGSSLPAKAVQLLREVTPTMRSIAALLNLADPFHIVLHREVADAARAEQLEFLPIMLKGRDEIEPAFADLVRRGIGGVFVQPSLPIAYCAELSIKHRLPSVSLRREFAEAGGLMSYGASQPAVHRVLAGYVDKVLKGTPTSSLPVQVAAYFELVLNQKTAKALGITLSPMFLGKVDEVIE